MQRNWIGRSRGAHVDFGTDAGGTIGSTSACFRRQHHVGRADSGRAGW